MDLGSVGLWRSAKCAIPAPAPIRHAFFIITLLVPLASCSSAPPVTFDLASVDPTSLSVRHGRGQIVVNEPIASLPIDSVRIVIRTGPEAVAYLKGAQWADQLPRLVQTRLIATFENAGRTVGRPGMIADYSLQTEIRHFEADVARNEAIVEISSRLVDSRGRVVASGIFNANSPLIKDDGPSVTAALDHALADAMRKIVAWTATRV